MWTKYKKLIKIDPSFAKKLDEAIDNN